MANRHSIDPFPPDIDRDYFGAWLTGFTDGEGHFGLAYSHHKRNQLRHPVARFIIRLRADDVGALKLIQSYWRCGCLHGVHQNYGHLKAQPQYALMVGSIKDLVSIVVPHFSHFPLLAKKRGDYALWLKGVDLIRGGGAKGNVGRGYPGTSRWTSAVLAQFEAIRLALMGQRQYEGPATLPLPKPALPPSLFDGLE